jgi:hypothetical protein
MKLYLDTCVWGRPYDDFTDTDMAAEAVAIMSIATLARSYGYTIYGSATLEEEINANPKEGKRADAMTLYNATVTNRAIYEENSFDYYAPLARGVGIRGYDVFHLCLAIAAGADYLLTVDKKFVKATAKVGLPILVINPLNFPLGGVI